MKILALSDIHDDFERFPVEEFPDADLCLIAGDLTNFGTRGEWMLSPLDWQLAEEADLPGAGVVIWEGREITRAKAWLRQLTGRYPIYFIPGNHDIGVNNDTFEEIPGCFGILDRTVTIDGIRIHGVSLSPCYDAPFLAEQWDYMSADEQIEHAAYDFESVDIVLSHSPPYGCLDVSGYVLGQGPRHLGSRALLSYILAHAPRLVICGHIHEGQGSAQIGGTDVYNLAGTWTVIELASHTESAGR